MSAALLLSLRVSLFQTPLFHVLPFLADFLKDHGKGLFAAVYQVWSLNQFFMCLLFNQARSLNHLRVSLFHSCSILEGLYEARLRSVMGAFSIPK